MKNSRKYLDEAFLKISPIVHEELKQKEPTQIIVRAVNEELPTERPNRRANHITMIIKKRC
jgi:hypothetical protein